MAYWLCVVSKVIAVIFLSLILLFFLPLPIIIRKIVLFNFLVWHVLPLIGDVPLVLWANLSTRWTLLLTHIFLPALVSLVLVELVH